MIVGARLKGEHRQALTIGWYAGSFGRVERMKPLAEYLKTHPTLAEKRAQGAARLAAMLDRMERKQEAAISAPGP